LPCTLVPAYYNTIRFLLGSRSRTAHISYRKRGPESRRGQHSRQCGLPRPVSTTRPHQSSVTTCRGRMACSPRQSPAVGAMFGTPESCRKVSGVIVKSLHKDEQAAFADFCLPNPVVQNLALHVFPSNFDHNQKQRDEPSVEDVWSAVSIPRTADSALPRQGNVLNSPRRAGALGQTLHHATPWQQTSTFTLSTPYAIATNDSRFHEAKEDKAALAAVAFSAGMGTAAPAAGMTTSKGNTLHALPSMRNSMLNDSC